MIHLASRFKFNEAWLYLASKPLLFHFFFLFLKMTLLQICNILLLDNFPFVTAYHGLKQSYSVSASVNSPGVGDDIDNLIAYSMTCTLEEEVGCARK